MRIPTLDQFKTYSNISKEVDKWCSLFLNYTAIQIDITKKLHGIYKKDYHFIKKHHNEIICSINIKLVEQLLYMELIESEHDQYNWYLKAL